MGGIRLNTTKAVAVIISYIHDLYCYFLFIVQKAE